MSSSRTSVLVPLGRKSRVGTSSYGLLNPTNSTSLSMTPSPVATPVTTQSINSLSSMQIPSLSPAPSPSPVNSSLISSSLPLVSVGSFGPPSPEVIQANTDIQSSLSNLSRMPPSPRGSVSLVGSISAPSPEVTQANNNIQSSLSSLSRMPPSPRGSVGLGPMSVGSVGSVRAPSPEVIKANTDIQSSLSNLSRMPPSPRGSVGSLGPISSVGSGSLGPISSGLALPPISSVASGLALPAIGGSPEVVRANNDIQSSLSNLNNIQSSRPLSPSLTRLNGFSSGPIALPTIPSGTDYNSMDNSVYNSMDNMDNMVDMVDMDNTEVDMDYTNNHVYQVDLDESNRVENILSDAGYLPLDKVITKDDNNMLMCRYIKAMDTSGRTAYIDMDCDGLVSVDPNNMTMTKVSSASVVPYSIKMGAYEAASDVRGVAIVCDGEVCTIQKSSDLSPEETVFSQVGNNGSDGSVGMLPGHPIPYPIVSLSDIKENPRQVACSIKDSHDRMRNVSLGECKKETKYLLEATRNLSDEVSRYNNFRQLTTYKLLSTIKQMEELDNNFKRHPPRTVKGRKLQRNVHYNLRRRNDLVIDHLKLCESVNSRVNRVRELVDEIKQMNNYAEQLFSGLDTVFEE